LPTSLPAAAGAGEDTVEDSLNGGGARTNQPFSLLLMLAMLLNY